MPFDIRTADLSAARQTLTGDRRDRRRDVRPTPVHYTLDFVALR